MKNEKNSNMIDVDSLFSDEFNSQIEKQVKENARELKDFYKDNDPNLYFPNFGPNGEDNIAIVRLLPSVFTTPYKNENGDPIVFHIAKFRRHWYSEGTVQVKEICLKTSKYIGKKGQKCPICAYVDDKFPYAENASDSDKSNRGKRKSKEISYVNVYVVRDSFHPENNGKVLYMELNYDLMGKLTKALDGKKDSEGNYMKKPVNPFNLKNAPYFEINISQSSTNPKWRDMKDSQFTNIEGLPAAFMGGDKKKMIPILKKSHNLYEMFMSEEKLGMKSQEELCALVDGLYGTNYTGDILGEEVVDPHKHPDIGTESDKQASKENIEEAVTEEETEESQDPADINPADEEETESEPIENDFDAQLEESADEENNVEEPAMEPVEEEAAAEHASGDDEDDFNFNPDEFMEGDE